MFSRETVVMWLIGMALVIFVVAQLLRRLLGEGRTTGKEDDFSLRRQAVIWHDSWRTLCEHVWLLLIPVVFVIVREAERAIWLGAAYWQQFHRPPNTFFADLRLLNPLLLIDSARTALSMGIGPGELFASSDIWLCMLVVLVGGWCLWRGRFRAQVWIGWAALLGCVLVQAQETVRAMMARPTAPAISVGTAIASLGIQSFTGIIVLAALWQIARGNRLDVDEITKTVVRIWPSWLLWLLGIHALSVATQLAMFVLPGHSWAAALWTAVSWATSIVAVLLIFTPYAFVVGAPDVLTSARRSLALWRSHLRYAAWLVGPVIAGYLLLNGIVPLMIYTAVSFAGMSTALGGLVVSLCWLVYRLFAEIVILQGYLTYLPAEAPVAAAESMDDACA